MTEAIDPSAAQLAAALAKWAKNPLVRASGHAGDLKVLAEYLGAQQRRLLDCEARLAVLEGRRAGLPDSIIEALNSGDGSYRP